MTTLPLFITHKRGVSLAAEDLSRARRYSDRDYPPARPIRVFNAYRRELLSALIALKVLNRDLTFGPVAQVGQPTIERYSQFDQYEIELNYRFEPRQVPGYREAAPFESIEEGACYHCGGSINTYCLATPYWCLTCAQVATFCNQRDSVDQLVMLGNEHIKIIRAPSAKEQRAAFMVARADHLIDSANGLADVERAERKRDFGLFFNQLS